MTRNKDFFRKPYMETPEDDYSDMMKYIPDAAQPDYRSKPHSELIKPYDDRIRDLGYGEMEHFYPSNFRIPEQPPSVDADPIVSGEPDPCKALRHIPFGARQVYYKIPCGGTLLINAEFEGGLSPYKLIGGAGFLKGDVTSDENGNFYYRAPKECCEDITDNLYIEDACGRSTNIIIIVEAFDYLISNYSTVIIGPDAPSNGDCYYLQTPVPGTIWTITKGSIDSSGCVSDLAGECGVATITATFMCQDNEIVATKQVRMPLGVWVSLFSCGTGHACSAGELQVSIIGVLQYKCRWSCWPYNDDYSACYGLYITAGGIMCGIDVTCTSGLCDYPVFILGEINEWRCP